MKLPDETVVSGHLPERRDRTAFITVDEISQAEIGQAKRTFDGENETITASILTTVSISAYGNNAVAMAAKIKLVLQSSRLMDTLNAMQAGIVRFSDVRNLTATVGADYEERGQFDCVISHTHRIITPLEAIEAVEVSGVISVNIHK